MGVLDDYINGLEGKSDLDPLTIAKDLLGLHNQELSNVNEQLSSANAKIATVTEELAAKDTTIAEVEAEVNRVKTQNYDLIMSTGVNNNSEPNSEEERVIDASTITPDDLFASTN